MSSKNLHVYRDLYQEIFARQSFIWTQSLILHKLLTFTGTLSLSRFRKNWDIVVTNEFLGFNLRNLTF